MPLLKIIPHGTTIDFIGKRKIAFVITIMIMLVGLGSLLTKGLNMGIDFRGGVLIEASYAPNGTPGVVDVADLRTRIDALQLGEASLQTFGQDHTVLIRLQEQTGGDDANAKAVETVKKTLGDGWTYNRAESVGPTVGKELLKTGILATLLALAGVAFYVVVRFEWQFGVAALAATFHDVFVSLGLVSLLGWEFNLTTVAALLLLSGYSINDTVIVFDRIREDLRRYKSQSLAQIINHAVNATLARTLLTSGTTLLAITPMLFMGGEGLVNFTGVIVWGIFIGTFSSTYVAAALLLYLPPLSKGQVSAAATKSTAQA